MFEIIKFYCYNFNLRHWMTATAATAAAAAAAAAISLL
jgi:hypothetical protein